MPLYIKAPSPEDDTAVDALLDQARSAGDPFLAVTFYEKVLRSRPDDTIVMGEAADLMLHAGETQAAKEVRVPRTSIVWHANVLSTAAALGSLETGYEYVECTAVCTQYVTRVRVGVSSLHSL